MRGQIAAKLRRALLWTVTASLGLLALLGVILSREFTGGGAPFFLAAALFSAPPVHRFWTRRFTPPGSAGIACAVLLSLIGLVPFSNAIELRYDQPQRAAGWPSDHEAKLAPSFSLTSPGSQAPQPSALDDQDARLRAVGEAQGRDAPAETAAASTEWAASAKPIIINCWPQFVEEYNHDGSMQRLPAPSEPLVVTVQGAKVIATLTKQVSPVTLSVSVDNSSKLIATQFTADGNIVLTWFKAQRAVRFGLFYSQVGLSNSAPPGVTPGLVSQYHRCEPSM